MDDTSKKVPGVYRAVRISPDLDRALHDIAERMSSPYQKTTLSTAIRTALVEGVAILDAKLPRPAGGAAPSPSSSAKRKKKP